MINKQNHNKKGFTLIELLIVIAVIGVLAAVILIVINPLAQLQKARDAGRKSDIKQIKNAMDSYFIFSGKYPCHSTCGWSFPSGLIGLSDLKVVPKDPLVGDSCAGTNIPYLAGSNGSVYEVFANLENAQDPDALRVKTTPPYAIGTSADGYVTYTITAGTCGGKKYNYWLTSND